MSITQQHSSPVIYVAGSARELPAEVQDWLGQAENRALASPHIYDLLAQLARGKKFAAIVVNIGSVDWSEMEFFDHAARLSRSTPIYVAGPHPQRAKLEAACRRGARLFDAVTLSEQAGQTVVPISLETAPPPHAPEVALPEFSPVNELSTAEVLSEPDIELPEETEGSGLLDEPVTVPAATVPILIEPDMPAEPEPAPECEAGAARPQERSIEPPAPVPPPEPPQLGEAESRPPFRLAPSETDAEPRVMFPWSSNPNRPRRTPPRALENTTGQTSEPGGLPAPGRPDSMEGPLNIRLTPEEIAALMGKPRPGDQAREAP